MPRLSLDVACAWCEVSRVAAIEHHLELELGGFAPPP
jgi:hypothetical protein